MNGLVKDCENADAAKKAAGKVNADIILIGQEARRKNEGGGEGVSGGAERFESFCKACILACYYVYSNLSFNSFSNEKELLEYQRMLQSLHRFHALLLVRTKICLHHH